MSRCCKPNYDPCLDGKLNQVGSYASAARQSAESAAASAAEAEEILEEIEEFFFMPTGGGTDKVFYLNDNQVTADYTIPPGRNAMSAGPITVVPGVTVTVPPGQAWTII
jgi:hypothetical protein